MLTRPGSEIPTFHPLPLFLFSTVASFFVSVGELVSRSWHLRLRCHTGTVVISGMWGSQCVPWRVPKYSAVRYHIGREQYRWRNNLSVWVGRKKLPPIYPTGTLTHRIHPDLKALNTGDIFLVLWYFPLPHSFFFCGFHHRQYCYKFPA